MIVLVVIAVLLLLGVRGDRDLGMAELMIYPAAASVVPTLPFVWLIRRWWRTGRWWPLAIADLAVVCHGVVGWL